MLHLVLVILSLIANPAAGELYRFPALYSFLEVILMSKLPRSPSRTTTGFAFSILDRAIRENFADRL